MVGGEVVALLLPTMDAWNKEAAVVSDYDAHQMTAYPCRCVRCGRWHDVTRWAVLVCRDCRWRFIGR